MAGKKKWSFTDFEDPAMSEAVKELQINRTLYVAPFSKDDDMENELVEVGNTGELFEKIPARASVEIETLEGDMDAQELHFKNISTDASVPIFLMSVKIFQKSSFEKI